MCHPICFSFYNIYHIPSLHVARVDVSIDYKCEWKKWVEWVEILWTTCICEIKGWNRIVLDVMACNFSGWRRHFPLPRCDIQTPSLKQPSDGCNCDRFVIIRYAVMLLLGSGDSSVGVGTRLGPGHDREIWVWFLTTRDLPGCTPHPIFFGW
jgi:hypothetical protein